MEINRKAVIVLIIFFIINLLYFRHKFLSKTLILQSLSWSGLERTSLKGDVYRFGVRQGIIEDGTFKQARLKDYDTAINGLTVTNQYVVRNDGQVVAQVEWLNGDPDNRPTVFGRLYRQLAGQTEARVAPDTTIARFSKIDGKIIWNGLEMTTFTYYSYGHLIGYQLSRIHIFLSLQA